MENVIYVKVQYELLLRQGFNPSTSIKPKAKERNKLRLRKAGFAQTQFVAFFRLRLNTIVK